MWSNKYVGIPFKNRGRDPRTGLDCWGLLHVVLRDEFGIHIPMMDEAYRKAQDKEEIGALFTDETHAFRKEWRRITVPRAGDAIVLRLQGRPCHVGIVTGDGTRFLHTEPGKNAVQERWDSLAWMNHVDSFWRHVSR